MSDLLERLRGRGWRLTSQRRVVAEVLSGGEADSGAGAGGGAGAGAGEHVHLTADEVHARAARRLPEISRATVYNTLGELVSLGEVIEVATDGRAKRYDPNAHRPHQHLVCSACGAVRDVHPTGDPLADLPATERYGFTISSVEITYRGHCPSCA
jgi:Fur family ferric uptake transcriptional regulator